MRILVCHHPPLVERKKRILEQFPTAEFITDYSDFADPYFLSREEKARIKRATMSLFLKHRKILEIIAKESSWVLVLEDDAQLPSCISNLKDFVDAVLKKVAKADIIFVGGQGHSPCPNDINVYPINQSRLTHGILIHPNAAKRLLQQWDVDPYPADWNYNYIFKREKFNVYGTTPFIEQRTNIGQEPSVLRGKLCKYKNLDEAAFLTTVDIDGYKVSTVSWMLENLFSSKLAIYQARVFEKLGIHLEQGFEKRKHSNDLGHGQGIDRLLHICPSDILVLFDVDAIPLKSDTVKYMVNLVRNGGLAGIEQDCNSGKRGEIYAGPGCMAVNMNSWRAAGQPTATRVDGLDTAQNLTVMFRKRGLPVTMVPFDSCEIPLWSLGTDRKFGIGSTYGNGRIYHLYQSIKYLPRFVKKCKEIL